MSEKLQIVTRVRRLFHYIDDFQKGIIRVPAFQRDFVWSIRDKLELFDSIKNGFPIGSILFWRPGADSDGEFFKSEAEEIGGYYIPEPPFEHFYILDGFQRISTLFGSLVNPYQTNLRRNDSEWQKQYNLVYNLKEDKFEQNRKEFFESLEIHKVPLYKFVDSKEFFGFQRQLYDSNLGKSEIEDYLSKYETLSARLVDYQIPSIDIIGGTVIQAVDIFSRVNSRGVTISDDWKVSALSFNSARNFKLGNEISGLLEKLRIFNFNTIKRNLVLQCIQNSFGKVFFDQTKPGVLEELAVREDFIDVTRLTLISILKAVRFLHDELWVLSAKLLPYNNQLIFLTDYFAKRGHPDDVTKSALKKWFWFTSYSGYFTLYNLSKQRQAYYHFQRFISGDEREPIYLDAPSRLFAVPRLPSKISLGSVRSKSLVLFMLNQLKKKYSDSMVDAESYKNLPLFTTEDRDLKMAPENQVFFVKMPGYDLPASKTKLSFMLDSQDDLNCYFISDEMKRAFDSGQAISTILAMRKRDIIIKERKFVLDLGLSYEE